jgi:hypothetical protein
LLADLAARRAALYQHAVIDIGPERFLDSLQIRLVPVRLSCTFDGAG